MAKSLRLEEFSDREFLFAVDDSINGEGYATAAMVQQSLQLDHPRAAQCIGSRLGYLRTIGVVESDPEKRGARWWRITSRGQALMAATLTQAQQRALDGAGGDKSLATMRTIIGQLAAADDMTARMMQREFRYGAAERRRQHG